MAIMNRALIILCGFIFLFCSPIAKQDSALIQFSRQKLDFGTIPYKKEVSGSFKFINPGDSVLLINNVKTSCGCTIAEWTKKPIKNGESGLIDIKYNAAFPGTFHKTITVYYNGEDSPAILVISGEVEYTENTRKKIGRSETF